MLFFINKFVKILFVLIFPSNSGDVTFSINFWNSMGPKVYERKYKNRSYSQPPINWVDLSDKEY